jgi:hypothetical protein
MKGSEIKSAAEQAEMKRALLEFTQKIEHDPYQPGIPHVDLYPDDIAEIIEDLIWIRGFDNITIKIHKTGESIKAEVIERNK